MLFKSKLKNKNKNQKSLKTNEKKRKQNHPKLDEYNFFLFEEIYTKSSAIKNQLPSNKPKPKA